MKKRLQLLFTSFALMFLLSACTAGTGTIRKDLLDQTKKIGVISVVMDKAGPDSPGNMKVRKKVMRHALKTYEKALGDMPYWTVVPSTSFNKSKVLKQMVHIPANPETDAFLMDLANKDQMPLDNEAVFAQAVMAAMSMDAMKLKSVKEKAVKESAKEIQNKIILDAASKYTGAPSLPIITYAMVRSKGGPKYHLAAAQAIIRKNIVTFCRENNLDAVVVVHLRSAIETTGKMHMIVDGRAKGIIKVNPTLVMVASNGETLLIMSYPVLDDLAPMDVGPPVFIGKPGTANFKIDLNDTKGNVLKAYNALIDKTCRKLTATLTKDINEE